MSSPELQGVSVPAGARFDRETWDFILRIFGGPWRAIGVFALCYAAMSALGYHFKVDLSMPAVMWPAAGVLFSALWFFELRWWPWLLLAQVAADLGVTALVMDPFPVSTALLYALSNSVGGVFGAALARRYVSSRSELRTGRSLQMLLATAVGSAVGALPGVWANFQHFGNTLGFFTHLQVWGAGNWLGLVTMVPVLNSWLSPLRQRYPELGLRSRVELLFLAALLAMATIHVFGSSDQPKVLLQSPFIVVALLVYAAYRLPPRWAATLAMLVCLVSVELVRRGGGPYSGADVFTRNAQMQGMLAAIVVVSFVMSMALLEIRLAMRERAESESRYRSLVELSTEAIWRVELDVPMPLSLAPAAQVEWLHRHARVAECNRAFLQVDPSSGARDGHWEHQIPWSDVYESHIEQVIRGNYAIDGLRFTVMVRGSPHTYLTAFSGVVRDGRLLRIWGVAQDISQLVTLNARLQREQDRLRSYARQIATAEEKARRATAVDLHDGIGQSLVGMAMTLGVAREGASAEVRLLIDEARSRLRDVQERTRHMISDLSPPGLYDLGLGPALQWLAGYMRASDRLDVSLQVHLDEEAVRLDTRILVFKLVRELLRNVAKHSGTEAASVAVRGDGRELVVEVADNGRGFDAQLDLAGISGAGRGFGLWSIADRLQEVGGTWNVDAAPGRGARFVLRIPLQAVPGEESQVAFRSA
jgi:signal transduction histidine kinase